MPERTRARTAFLAAHGFAGAEAVPLAADASFRSYHRIVDGDRRAMLMDAPPGKEDVRPFARLAHHLDALGFSVPKVRAADEDAGFLLLDDLGDDTFTRVIAAGGDEAPLYRTATDVLIALHELAAETAIPAGLPAYDEHELFREADLFADWYLPAVLRRRLADDELAAWHAAWRPAFQRLAAKRETLVLRDFHVDNLMWLGDRKGVRRCALLDFQDALAGPRAYDLMSLVEDARRDLAPGLAGEMVEHYLAAFPALDREEFRADLAVLAAQRHAKVIGIFTRLWRRDGKPHYLGHIPRIWRLFEAALAHPMLDGVRTWIDATVPSARRVAPDTGQQQETEETAR